MREAFEHWYADHTGDAHIRKYCDSTGRYQFNAMQSSWEAWQAAQAQAVNQQLPSKRPIPDLMMASYHEAKGWNDCIDAIAAAKEQGE